MSAHKKAGSENSGNNPEGIAELLAFAVKCLENTGLTKFELRVGYLEILKNILNSWKIPLEIQAKLMISIDKGDLESLRIMLEDTGLEETKIVIFSDLVQTKINASDFDDHYKILTGQFPSIIEHLDRFRKVLGFLSRFGLDEITVDLGIARGLDYYTGIVFEIDVPTLGAEKQVCGGGEYSLDEMFKLKDVACSGFAIGFDRVVLAFELESLKTPENALDVYIISLSPPGLEKGIELAMQLRSAGIKVDLDIKGRNMSKNLKFASSQGAKFAIFIGEDELKKGVVLVRNMGSGEQEMIKFESLTEYFSKCK